MESHPKWYKEYCFKLHKKNLKIIQSKSTNRIDFKKPESLDLLLLHHEMNYIKRKRNSIEIYEQNQNFLKRITEVSKAKPRFSSQTQLKPLNLKQQNIKNYELILRNLAMTETLSHVKSELSTERLAKDYEKTKKLKKLLKQKPKFSKFLSKKLPPIERTSKNKSINESQVNIRSISEAPVAENPSNGTNPEPSSKDSDLFKPSPLKSSSLD